MRDSMPLQRHRLAWLSDAAWTEVLGHQAWDAQSRACLAHWRACELPLVVARQPQQGLVANSGIRTDIYLGLPMPNQWGRGRLSIQVNAAEVRAWGEFPAAAAADALLPEACRVLWRRLCDQWQAVDCDARIYGGYGWQLLSGLVYLRPASDLDLLWPVHDAGHADGIAHSIQACEQATGLPRMDGELVFPDHSAVNWREWLHWRSGQAQAILVKRIDGVQMYRQPWWPDATSTLRREDYAIS